MELADKVRKADKVLIIGNGGSAANAIHMCNDLVLGCGYAAFTPDVASFSAAANDLGYERSFARWVEICGRRGDLLIALSGSGKSPNILAACAMAEAIGMDVWREFGAAQGFDMESAEERQIWLGHELKRALRGPR